MPFRWPETSTLSPTTKSQDSSEFWRFLIVDKPKVGEKSEKKEKIKLIYALKYITTETELLLIKHIFTQTNLLKNE